MSKELVIVKSKTITHETVPVVYRIVKRGAGELCEERELSRSYIFEDYQAIMPREHAEILVNNNSDEFKIIGRLSEAKVKEDANTNGSEDKKDVGDGSNISSDAIATSMTPEDDGKVICSVCRLEFVSKVGLMSHTRAKHPEEYKKLFGKSQAKGCSG